MNVLSMQAQPAPLLDHALNRRVAIIGSRGFPYAGWVDAYVRTLPQTVVIISGGAVGPDTWAVESATKLQYPTPIVHLPKAADGAGKFHARNRVIVEDCDRLVAFWDGQSAGTKYTVDYARKRRKHVTVVTPTDVPFEIVAELRRRVTNGFEWLQGHLDGNQPGVRKLTALIVREYMPALNAYRERLTPEEREALAVAYAKKVDGAADDDEYAARLNDYMVAADIADQTTLSWMLASVRLWEEAGQ